MNKGRLRHLIKILQENEKEKKIKLTMRRWYDGEMACAGGIACLSKTFNKQGLYYNYNHSNLSPQYGDTYGYHAIEAFFSLSRSETFAIFCAKSYDPFVLDDPNVNEKDIIDRIRSVIGEAI